MTERTAKPEREGFRWTFSTEDWTFKACPRCGETKKVGPIAVEYFGKFKDWEASDICSVEFGFECGHKFIGQRFTFKQCRTEDTN